MADDLSQAANSTADLVDRLSRTFARQLASVLRDLERQLRPLIKDAAEGNRTAIVRAARAGRTRREIRDVLAKSGYPDLAVVSTDAPLDDLLAAVLKGRRLAKASAELSASAETKVEALKALQEQDLLGEGDDLAQALWKATVRGVFGSRGTDAILGDLYDVIDRTEAQIATLYDTALSIYARQVEALAAGDEPETVFAYLGPNDDRTRPFCEAHVGKVYTRETIDQMDNGQLGDVFLTGGGYNCRHRWIEVSKFSDAYDLANTGKRMAEYERSAA